MTQHPNPALDTEAVAHGIRLGSQPNAPHLAQLADARTVEDLERAVRPVLFEDAETLADWRQPNPGFEHVGLAQLCPADETARAVAATTPGWHAADGTLGLATAWHGWLPGIYTDRTAALTAYGYVLAGEHPGHLDEIWHQALRERQRPIAAIDIGTYARQQEPTA